jgi:hypothetical protein
MALGTLPENGNSSRIVLVGILIFKGLTARRLYKSFGVKGLIFRWWRVRGEGADCETVNQSNCNKSRVINYC